MNRGHRPAPSSLLSPTRWAVALWVLVTACVTEVDAASTWRRLRSPHFVVVGDASERDLRRVAEQVELFREALVQMLPGAAGVTAVPTTIVVFRSDRAFTPYKLLVAGKAVEQMGGYFLAGEDAGFIAISLEAADAARRTIFHEYTHAFVHATVKSPPAWLNEGLAEVYSTFELRDAGRVAVVGLAPDDRLREARAGPLIPLHELLTASVDAPLYHQPDRRGMFYAQSWALTHYLLYGARTRQGQLRRYLSLLEGSTNQAEAFRQAFACEPSVLEAELRDYVKGFVFDSVRRDLKKRVGTTSVSGTVIEAAEAHAYLAELLARHERTDEAQAMFERALEARPDLPRALAGLGRLYVRMTRVDEGLPLLERAAAAAPDDAPIVAAYGRTLVDQVQQRGPFEKPDAQVIERARMVLARAAALDPQDAHVVALRGVVELIDGAHLDRARSFLEQAMKSNPVREDYELLLAQVLVKERDELRAVGLLNRLSLRGSRADVREHAQQLKASLEPSQASHTTAIDDPDTSDTEVNSGGDLGDGASRVPRVRADSSSVVTRDGRRVHLLLRVVGPQEARVAASVDRIECRTADLVVYVREVSGRRLQLTAERLDAIEFISYLDGRTSALACAVFTPPLSGLVTYRPRVGGAAADGEALAIELVPSELTGR